jgi:hypothetical protein
LYRICRNGIPTIHPLLNTCAANFEFFPPKTLTCGSKARREHVEQRHPRANERPVHPLATVLRRHDAILQPPQPFHGRLPLLLLLLAAAFRLEIRLSRAGPGLAAAATATATASDDGHRAPAPPEEVGDPPHGRGGHLRGRDRRQRGRHRAGRRRRGGGGQPGEDGGGRGRRGARGGRDGVGHRGLAVVRRHRCAGAGRAAVREAAQRGGEAGEVAVGAAPGAERRRQTGGVAAAQRGVRLAEKLAPREQRLADAPVRVGQEEEVVQQALGPRCRRLAAAVAAAVVADQRVPRLRVVEQVRQPGQEAGQVRRPVGDPRRVGLLRRLLGPADERVRRLVQARHRRVEAPRQAVAADAGVGELPVPRSAEERRRLRDGERREPPAEPRCHLLLLVRPACCGSSRSLRSLLFDVPPRWW